MRTKRSTFVDRRRGGVALAATVAVLASTLGLGVAGDSTTALAQTNNACDESSTTPQNLDFLLPAWADLAGWSNPQQNLTISGADIDGDGNGELIGRNSANLEVFHWAPVSERMGDEAPGQWATWPVLGPAMEETDGFFDPSLYATIQAADLDGNGDDEVFYRSTTGIQVLDYANGAWAAPVAGPGFGDTNVWNTNFWESQYYATITAGDVDGDHDADIIGRTSAGITSWAHQSGGTFAQLEESGSTLVMSDADGWNDAGYSDTIQTADVDGDGDDDLIGLSPNGDGLQLYSLNVTSPGGQGTWDEVASTGPWGSSSGWSHSQFTSTITTGNIDEDPADEVIGIGPYGLDAYGWDTTANGGAGGWVEEVAPPTSSSPGALYGSPFNQAPYYSTLQTASLVQGQPDQVLVRNTDGVHVLSLDTTTDAFTDSGSTATQFSDANGWNQSVRYPTIQTVAGPSGQGDLLIGRDATGVQTFQLPGLGQAWVDPDAPFPSWTDADAPDTEQSRAYRYINENAVTVGGTVLGAFQELTADLDQLHGSIEALKLTKFINVSRQVWDEVKQQTLRWTDAVENLQAYLGVGTESGAGLANIMLESFVTAGSGASIDDIADQFNGSSTVIALIGDLIWGALGALPGGAFITSEGGKMVFTAAMSIAGASTSAGMGFANTSGSVSSEAKDLQEKSASSFCAGIEYLDLAYGQIVANLGQLTAMEQMMSDGVLAFTNTQETESLTAANNARQLWAYQQFSSMSDHGWRAGYCEMGQTCVMNPRNTSGQADYSYKALPTDGVGTPNCDYDPGGSTLVEAWPDVIALGADPDTQIFAPEVPVNRPSVGVPGAPYDSLFQHDAMGLLGWRLPTHSCHS